MGLTVQIKLPETRLRPITEERVREAYDRIDREILNTWRFFTANHDVLFEGSPCVCFWAGKQCGKARAIRPALKEAIKSVLTATADDCRKHGLQPDTFMEEVAYMLEGLVESVCRDMIRIDRLLRGRGFPKKVNPVPMEYAQSQLKTYELDRYIDEQARAISFLASSTTRGSLEESGQTLAAQGQVGGTLAPEGQTRQSRSQPVSMTEAEIQQVREYADRVAGLLQPMEMPPPERTWESEPAGFDSTSEVAQRMAAEWDRVLHPLRVEYRKRVVDVLGDGNWEPIADVFEHYASQTFVRLNGWRQDILDHTEPGRDRHMYWLESCGEGHKKYGPNSDLKNRLENLVGKLRRWVDRAEQALNQEGANMHELDQQAPKPDIPGLIDRLKTYKRANEAGGEEPVKKTMECLKQYAGSAEELWAFLDGCKDKYGASANMKNAIDAVKGARMSWGGGGFYPALWNMLATKEVISELERWLAQKGRLQSESLQPPVGSMLQEETRPKDCTHSDDFSSVVWYGVPHHFTATQASCVALLWTEWEKDPQAGLGLREKFIGEKIGSSNENYRLAHTFRHKGRPHPAWGTMIHSKGDGFFCLAGPEAANKTKKRRKK